MTTPNHASLSYQDALSSAAGVAFGVTPFYACLDFEAPCFNMVVAPTYDPLYTFPPSSYFLTFSETYSDLVGDYLQLNFTTVRPNTIVVVVGLNIDNVAAYPNPYVHENVVCAWMSWESNVF